MTASITYVKNVSVTSEGKFAMSIIVHNSVKMPKELFVLKKSSQAVEYDTYDRVASKNDMYTLKRYRTSADTEYLANSMVYTTDNLFDLEAAYPYITSLLQELVDYYNTSIPALVGKEEVITLS
jgi:hypothetical protein